MKINRKSITLLPLMLCALFLSPVSFAADEKKPEQTHRVGAAKLMVDDLATNRKFYEDMFGMKVVRHYDYDLDTFEEDIMGFANGGPTIALFAPNEKVEKPLKKAAAPVVLINTPEFDAVTERIKTAGYRIAHLPTGSTNFRIAIARDPSGNAVEILARGEEYSVGGSKLIVNDRAAAEEFYTKVFNAEPGTRYQTKTYDEVLMLFGGGPFLALFQPLDEEPLVKSRFAVTAIYTKNFDAVVKNIESAGLGYRKVKTNTPGMEIIIAQDPAGNAIEIIKE